MRKLAPILFLVTIAIALPSFATITPTRSQSYFTYDDGGTTLRSGEDGRESDVRVNLPLFPGDEVLTSRRGRSEIRLSDGNILALDRATAIRFKTIANGYDSDANDTIAELRFGHVVVQRVDGSREDFRLDSDNASYVAIGNALYAIETDGRGKDRITVFDGTVEVRTPARTTTLRGGDEAHVDDSGLYGVVSVSRASSDDFERWSLTRAERYARRDGRYLDDSLAYAESDLSDNGTWVYVDTYGGWCWRPRVAAGWRPYYSGHWARSITNCLTWVSYEPWGWVPYHYGRWSYEANYGWVWLPGSGYAPAWVYWIYGPQYIGWAPAGWYDCYRPYYNWAYRPYHRNDIGFGFYGRVRVGDIDLRPWTFVTPDTLVYNRVDRAALTTEVVRERLHREGSDNFATVSGMPARFSRNELKDPSAAINNIARRGIGSGTGKEGSGSPADMTPFFRRDPELSNAVRERIVRTRPVGGASSGATANVPGVIAGGGATVERGAPEHTGGNNIGRDGGSRRDGNGTNSRGSGEAATVTPDGGVQHGREPITGGWRVSGDPRGATRPTDGDLRNNNGGATTTTPAATAPVSRGDEWRGRGRVARGSDAPRTGSGDTPRATEPDRGSLSDIPRRIIDRIGGARTRPSTGESSHGSSDTPRSSGRESNRGGRERDSNSGSHESSGGGRERDSGSHSAPAPQPREQSAPPPQRDNGGNHHERSSSEKPENRH
jgi:hypothetical protein